MVEAVGTIKINKAGDAVSNVTSSAQQMAERGKLHSREPWPKILQNTSRGITSLIDFEIVDGEFVVVRTPYRRSQ